MEFYPADMKRLKAHIELSNYCNAMCPMCGRNRKKKEKPNELYLASDVNTNELTIDHIKAIFDDEFFETYNFKLINFCGNRGDPATANDLFEIYEYFFQKCPGIRIYMATNGGLKTTSFWTKLGKLVKKYNTLNKQTDYTKQSKVTFGIDGLADTNHIYRQNVNYDKVMANAKAYLDAGGTGAWQYLVFKHNEHQVDEALLLSKEMGFSNFFTIHTPRFAYNSNGTLKPGQIQFTNKGETFILETADPDFEEKKKIKQFIDSEESDEIECKAHTTGEFYLSCKGNVYPCCWLGNSVNYYENYGRWKDLVMAEYDANKMSAIQNSLTQILQSEFFNETIPETWNNLGENCRSVNCKMHCSKNKNLRKQRNYL
jgi:MoaA/NifB/PqqE/SkfB family radical SAM enzyme